MKFNSQRQFKLFNSSSFFTTHRFTTALILIVLFQIGINFTHPFQQAHHLSPHQLHQHSLVQSSPSSESVPFETKPLSYLKNALSPYTSIRFSDREMLHSQSYISDLNSDLDYVFKLFATNYESSSSSSNDDFQQYFENRHQLINIFQHFFVDYIKFHSVQRHNKSCKLLIFRPHPTGIGDRFRPFIFSFFLSVLSKRLFLIDWQAPFPLSTFLTTNSNLNTSFFYHDYMQLHYDSHLRNWDGTTSTSDTDKGTTTTSTAYNGKESELIISNIDKVERIFFTKHLDSNVKFLILCMHNPPTDNCISDYASNKIPFTLKTPSKLPSITRNSDFQRYFFHHLFQINDEIRRDYLQKCKQLRLRCSPSLLLRTSSPRVQRKQHPRQTPSTSTDTPSTTTNEKQSVGEEEGNSGGSEVNQQQPYIGVHARLGVGLGEGKLNRFYPLAKNIVIPARCLASRAIKLSLLSSKSASTLPIFLATDTPEFRELFTDIVHEMSDGRIAVMSGDWHVGHTDRLYGQHRQKGFVFDKSLFHDEWNIVWGTYMDLILLGHSDHIVSIYSTFPVIAHAIGDAMSLTQLKPDICTVQESWM